MGLTATELAVLELLVGVFAAAGTAITWAYREQPAGRPLIALFAAGSGYAFASGLNVLVADPLVQHLLHNLTYPLGFIVSGAVLYLAIEFTQWQSSQRRAVVVALVTIVAVDFALAVTDPVHNLYITERIITAEGGFERTAANTGTLFWVRSLLGFAIATAGLGLMLIYFPSARGIYRKQSAVIVVAYLIGLGAFLWQTFSPVHAAFDVATVGLLIGAVLILWALFYTEFLEIVPIAQRTLMDSIETAVIALDGRDRIVDLNRRAGAVFDLDDESIGARIDRVDGFGFDVSECLGATADGEQVVETQRDGSRRYYGVRVAPIEEERTSVAEPLGRLLLVRDITEQKERERELERQNERLDRFAAIVSHDLRNPLHVASGYTTLAEEDGDPDAFERVHEAHDRMRAMIEKLLTMARTDIDVDRLDDIELVDLVQRVWGTARTPDVTLVVDIEPGTTAKADPTLLSHVLENLFENAAIHNGRPLEITVGVLFAGEIPTGIYVEDDGRGIDSEDSETVFERGYTTDADGRGIGLSIVREYADAHGWELDLTESETGGARFEFLGVDIDQ
jgi:signal transduction histidine kinase